MRFRDADGAEWQVHEVVRQAGSGARSAYLPDTWQHGWLLFECGAERRRLAPVPEDWRERDAAGLAALLASAVVAKAERTSGAGGRVSSPAPETPPPEAAHDPRGPTPDARAPTRDTRRAASRVLVVDDDEAARYLMRRALDELPVEVIEAATGSEAIACARADRPHLIVLDYRLPGTTGAAVLDQLRADPATAGIPVLWYSLHERALDLDPRTRHAAGRIDKVRFDPAAARAHVAALLERQAGGGRREA